MSGKSVFSEPDDDDDERDDEWSEGLGGVRDTSREAYRNAEAEGTLSKRRKQCYELLRTWGPCTALELQQHATVEGLWKRLSELERADWARELPERKCRVSGRTAIVWEATEGGGKVEPRKRKTAGCWILLQDGAPIDAVFTSSPPFQDGETWVRARVTW